MPSYGPLKHNAQMLKDLNLALAKQSVYHNPHHTVLMADRKQFLTGSVQNNNETQGIPSRIKPHNSSNHL